MPQTYRDLRLDVTRADYQSVGVNAKQYDSQSRYLRVTITNGGVPVPVPQGTQVFIGARRADGESNAFLGTVEEDGNVIVPLAAWMLEIDGRVECSVTTVDTEGRRLATLRFYVVVQDAEYSGSDIDQDENYDILVDLLAEVAQYSVAEAGRVEAEEGRVEAEEGRVEAEAERLQKWGNATATAHNLPEGATATATVTQSENGTNFDFGIPKGDKGDLLYATFGLDPTSGRLLMYADENYAGPVFSVSDSGYLMVEVSAT